MCTRARKPGGKGYFSSSLDTVISPSNSLKLHSSSHFKNHPAVSGLYCQTFGEGRGGEEVLGSHYYPAILSAANNQGYIFLWLKSNLHAFGNDFHGGDTCWKDCFILYVKDKMCIWSSWMISTETTCCIFLSSKKVKTAVLSQNFQPSLSPLKSLVIVNGQEDFKVDSRNSHISTSFTGSASVCITLLGCSLLCSYWLTGNELSPRSPR